MSHHLPLRRTAIVVGTLGLVLATLPAQATTASQDLRPQAMQTGRIYTATGVAWGGIIMMNVAADKAINLTTNTFGSDTKGSEPNYKSAEASLAANGLMSFASNRSGSWRIYVARGDGGKVRALTQGDASVPDDRFPVISPDGKRVAFVSKRPLTAGQPPSTSQDIWIVNVDGSGLRRVTTPEADSRADSFIRSLDWSDNGRRIAYRGTRLVQEGDTAAIREVLGFINANGRDETKLRIDDCGGGAVVDWVGPSVLYSLGGNVQGCYPTKYLIRQDTNGETVVLENAQLGPVSTGPGSARLSASGSSVLYTHYLPFNEAAVVRIGVDGTGRTQSNTRAIAPGVWLWWTPLPYPRATSLTIKPAKVRVRAGRAVTLTPILRDRRGGVLSRSGDDWRWVGSGPRDASISTMGRLRTSVTTPPGTYAAQIGNGGLTAEVRIVIRPPAT